MDANAGSSPMDYASHPSMPGSSRKDGQWDRGKEPWASGLNGNVISNRQKVDPAPPRLPGPAWPITKSVKKPSLEACAEWTPSHCITRSAQTSDCLREGNEGTPLYAGPRIFLVIADGNGRAHARRGGRQRGFRGGPRHRPARPTRNLHESQEIASGRLADAGSASAKQNTPATTWTPGRPVDRGAWGRR